MDAKRIQAFCMPDSLTIRDIRDGKKSTLSFEWLPPNVRAIEIRIGVGEAITIKTEHYPEFPEPEGG
ncbi:MAG TPA: hypothetical protein VMY35_08695 [Phycisphaerae bacterium]|nr:hypothetical protein [Phycisphaerae bacterium]